MKNITIALDELVSRDLIYLYNLLKKNKYNHLSFSIRKTTAICSSDHHEVMSEYMMQFFIAQNFEKMLNQFSHIPPPLHKTSAFIYSGIPKNFKELSNYLYRLITSISDHDKKINLQQAATDFFSRADYNEVVCYEYFIIAAQFLLMLNEN